MKTVALIISGRGNNSVQEIELHPGITASDVLSAANLGDGFLLSVEGAGHQLAAQEQVYELVPQGGKLRATPISEVGVARPEVGA